MYTEMTLWKEVRRAIFVDKKSKRQVCQEFHLHFTTLQKMLANDEPPGYRMKEPRKSPRLEPFIPFITDILEADKKVHRKQRHTATRILERLREESGYTGGKTVVFDLIRKLREKSKKSYAPLVKTPGVAQFDFGYPHVILHGEEMQVAMAVFSMPWSNLRFCQIFPKECTETFQEAIKRAIEFIDGVPQLIKFDNSSIAAGRIVKGRCVEPTREFNRIASHYLFDYYFCNVRQPQEKGHVENAVDYCRHHFLVPVPVIDDFESFNAILRQQCLDEMQKTSARQDRTIAELFREEQGELLPVPETEFEAGKTVTRQVNNLSLVQFDANEYSVPSECAQRSVTVTGGIDRIKVLFEGKVVAEHTRDWRKNQRHYEPCHYLALLSRRPHLLQFGEPFAHWKLPKDFGDLERQLVASKGKQGQREYIRILQLLAKYPLEQLSEAVTRALTGYYASYSGILFSIREKGEVDLELFALDQRPHLQSVQLPEPNLTEYTHYAREEICYEKDRNEIDRFTETSAKTVKTADDGTDVRGDGATVRVGECGPSRIPTPAFGAGTSRTRESCRGTASEIGEVPEYQDAGKFRLQGPTVAQ